MKLFIVPRSFCSALLMIGAACFLTACKINTSQKPEPPAEKPTAVQPHIQPATHALEIQFGHGTEDISQVDSVITVVRSTGNTQPDTVKLSRLNSLYYTDAIAAGSGQQQIVVDIYFARNAGDDAGRLFRRDTLMVSGKMAMAAPTGKYADQWRLAVLMTDPRSGAALIVPEKPEDPWFEARAPKGSPPWDYCYLIREYKLGSQVVASEAVARDTRPLGTTIFANGNYVEPNIFRGLSEKMKNKNWDRVEITGGLYISNGSENEEVSFFYQCPKRAD